MLNAILVFAVGAVVGKNWQKIAKFAEAYMKTKDKKKKK